MTYTLPRDMLYAADTLDRAAREVASTLGVDRESGPVVWTGDSIRSHANQLELQYLKARSGISLAITELVAQDEQMESLPPHVVNAISTCLADQGYRKLSTSDD